MFALSILNDNDLKIDTFDGSVNTWHSPGNQVSQYTERVEFTGCFIAKVDLKAEKGTAFH